MAEKDNYTRARLLRREITREMCHTTGDSCFVSIFRDSSALLQLQPYFKTITFFGNEISCAHIEVYLKKFFCTLAWARCSMHLEQAFWISTLTTSKSPVSQRESANPELPFGKDFFTTNGPTQSNITKCRKDSKSVELQKATGSKTQTTEQVTEEEMLDSLPGNMSPNSKDLDGRKG